MSVHRSVKERFFHALGFEVLALLICTPVCAWVLGTSMMHMGVLTLLVSFIAMSWNMIFNALFDAAQKRLGFVRTIRIRVVHTLLFELGLIVTVVPLAAWWLGIGLWQAFVLDLAIVLFFLPYTFGFNWTYDHLRALLVARHHACLTGSTPAAPSQAPLETRPAATARKPAA